MSAEHVPDIAEEYEALTQFMYLAPVGLAQTALDGEIVMINPVSAQLLMPLSRDGNLMNLFGALESVAPDLRSRVAGFASSHGMVCDSVRIQLSAAVRGRTEPQMLSLTLLKLDANRLMAVLSDVTQQVRRERLLRQNEAWFNALLTGITDYALISLDQHGCVSDWNPSIGRVTGFNRSSVLGQPFSIFYPDDATTPERVLDRLAEADANGWSLDDGWRRKFDGTRFWGSAMIAPLRERSQEHADPAGAGAPVDAAGHERAYCLVIRDITDRREASEIARIATSCDHLTGIANRRAFFEAAELEVERWRRLPRPLSLVMFDADQFKRINDRYGHAGGDAVLRHLAGLLTTTFREVDMAARLGGEEFAVLLPSTDIRGALAMATRLRHTMEGAVIDFEGEQIRCTVSGGVASMENDVTGLDVLMKRADSALYAAKNAGRNRIVCWAPPPAGSQYNE